MKKRLISVLLTLVILVGMLPLSSLAATTMTSCNVRDTNVSNNYSVFDINMNYGNFGYTVPEGGATVLNFFSAQCGLSMAYHQSLNGSQWLNNPYVNLVSVEVGTFDFGAMDDFITRNAPGTRNSIEYFCATDPWVCWDYLTLTGLTSGTYTYPVTLILTEENGQKTLRYYSFGNTSADNVYEALCAVSSGFKKYEDSKLPEAGPNTDAVTYRFAGENRFETALRVADAVKTGLGVDKFSSVILASGANFADALSGSYLATVKNAPILLAYKDKQNKMAIDYIKANLQPGGTVYILGGGAAVPESVDGKLSGFHVKRLAGGNRFETNLMILKEAGVPSNKEILVCTSTNFADSLSASATGCPILLVYNEKGKLTDGQKAFLDSLGSRSFRIIGGENAVSKKLADTLSSYGIVQRLAGSNRFDTSVKVARTYFNRPSGMVLAYAANYPDGLCGGVLAYVMGSPLILTMKNKETDAQNYAMEKGIRRAMILGGSSLIGNSSIEKIFVPASEDDMSDLSEAAIYRRMIAMKSEYPEGRKWNNDDYYAWKGGIYSGGYGCAGFAFHLSDAAFGTLKARKIYDNISIDTVRVGDILRINGDTHSVIILERYSDYVVIAEANYNNSVHWGRILSAQAVAEATYLMTRYPE